MFIIKQEVVGSEGGVGRREEKRRGLMKGVLSVEGRSEKGRRGLWRGEE